MTDSSKSNANNEPEPLKAEIKEGGIQFNLRDDVVMLVVPQSAKEVAVFMSRKDKLVPPDKGNVYVAAFRKRLAETAAGIFGKDAPHIAEDIDRVAITLGAPQGGGKTLLDELAELSERSVMERIISYALKSATLFHNSERERFARVKKGDHYENYDIRSGEFKDWVLDEYWRREKDRMEAAATEQQGEGALQEGPVKTGMPTVPRDAIVGDAIRQLSALARFEGPQEEVHIRTASHDDKVYIDMGDPEWRAIEVSPGGWRIVEGDDIPVRFVRPKGLLALPEPSQENGSLDALPTILNLGEGEDAYRNRTLILAWLTYAMTPATGGYPILLITGPQGAAKTRMLRTLRNTVDPSSAAGSTKPKNEHDAYIDASSNWVLAYDQLVTAPVWLSNVLCDLATGGGFRTRTLFTNRDQEIFADKRPIILAGIGNIASRPDLQDRAIPITLSRIKDEVRKTDEEVEKDIEAAGPEILGALLDAIAVGLAKKPKVMLDKKPRMADFAIWGVATEEILGGQRGDFMRAYWEVRKESTSAVLEEWPLTDTFFEFALLHKGEEGAWEGSATELLATLNDRVDDEDLKRSQGWPKTPSHLSATLNSLTPNLAEAGVVVMTTRTASKRTLKVFAS
jgi:hypothetical protein